MKLSVFALGFLFLHLLVFPDETFYSSNEIGMALFQIPAYRTDEYEYILSIDRNDLKETRRLIKNGEEIKKEELLHNKNGNLILKQTYEKDKLKEAEYFNNAGQMKKREFYIDGNLTEKEIFEYLNGKISKKFVYDSNDNLLYTDLYTLNKEGMLIKLIRKQEDSTTSKTVIVGDKNGIADELTGYADKINIVRYDLSGRIIETEEWNKDNQVSLKIINRSTKTDKIESVLKKDILNNTLTKEQYDSNEWLIYKKFEDNNGIVYEEWYTRDKEGRAVKIMRRSREKGVEEWDYSYGSGDTVNSERYRIHGSLQKETLYPDKNHRIEKFYRKGEEFIRVYYEEGEKIKEEIIKNGEVIRERNLKTE